MSDTSRRTTFAMTSLEESRRSLRAEMGVHRGQTMGWRWECYSCSASDVRMVPKKGRVRCSEPDRDPDP